MHSALRKFNVTNRRNNVRKHRSFREGRENVTNFRDSTWRENRRAFIAEQRNRRKSSLPKDTKQHNSQLDQSILRISSRFSEFPRFVSALDNLHVDRARYTSRKYGLQTGEMDNVQREHFRDSHNTQSGLPFTPTLPPTKSSPAPGGTSSYYYESLRNGVFGSNTYSRGETPHRRPTHKPQRSADKTDQTEDRSYENPTSFSRHLVAGDNMKGRRRREQVARPEWGSERDQGVFTADSWPRRNRVQGHQQFSNINTRRSQENARLHLESTRHSTRRQYTSSWSKASVESTKSTRLPQDYSRAAEQYIVPRSEAGVELQDQRCLPLTGHYTENDVDVYVYTPETVVSQSSTQKDLHSNIEYDSAECMNQEAQSHSNSKSIWDQLLNLNDEANAPVVTSQKGIWSSLVNGASSPDKNEANKYTKWPEAVTQDTIRSPSPQDKPITTQRSKQPHPAIYNGAGIVNTVELLRGSTTRTLSRTGVMPKSSSVSSLPPQSIVELGRSPERDPVILPEMQPSVITVTDLSHENALEVTARPCLDLDASFDSEGNHGIARAPAQPALQDLDQGKSQMRSNPRTSWGRSAMQQNRHTLVGTPLGKAVNLANRCVAAWQTVFPPKPEEEIKLERKIRNAVLRGDLHWSVLNDLKHGRPIQPSQMALLSNEK